jgi:hypothetical protein
MTDPSEPTVAEQLAAERARIFEAELAMAKLNVELELAEAKQQAAMAEARATYAERRLEELEHALGRRRRATHDRARGIQRLRDEP